MTSKFRGAYLHVLPNGVAHLAMHRSGDHYTWGRVSTTIYNIIVGKLWVDQVREKRGGREETSCIVYLSSCVDLLLPLLPPYQSGESEMVNHTTGDKCILKWNPYSYFSRERQRKVLGHTHSILICVEVSAPDQVYSLF